MLIDFETETVISSNFLGQFVVNNSSEDVEDSVVGIKVVEGSSVVVVSGSNSVVLLLCREWGVTGVTICFMIPSSSSCLGEGVVVVGLEFDSVGCSDVVVVLLVVVDGRTIT